MPLLTRLFSYSESVPMSRVSEVNSTYSQQVLLTADAVEIPPAKG